MNDTSLKTRLKDPLFYKLYHRALAEIKADEVNRLRMMRCDRMWGEKRFTSYAVERLLKLNRAEQRYNQS